MKVYIFLISVLAALATSCSNASGQTGQTFTENRFNVHAEMMAEQPRQITAKNVAIGNQGVTACFNSCQTQVTLNFCGQVLIEMPGQSPEVYPARVFQQKTFFGHIAPTLIRSCYRFNRIRRSLSACSPFFVVALWSMCDSNAHPAV